jgi:hypothetical protein
MVKGDIFDYFGIAGKTTEQLRAEGYNVWTPPRPKGDYLGEGDTGTFFNLLDNGLRGYRGDSFGGFGGYARKPSPDDNMRQTPTTLTMPPRAPTHPFYAAAQRDWAERFKWAVTPDYAGANHNPRIKLAGPNMITARPGQRLDFAATTSDPDGNAVSLKWWIWKEAGSYSGDIDFRPSGQRASLIVPADAKAGATIQVIAEATDDGDLPLTRYEKIVVTAQR